MGTGVGFQDFVGFMIFATIMGSFTFWVVAYFGWELIKYALHGPSEQLRSVGTSILAEPPLEAPRAHPHVTEHTLVPSPFEPPVPVSEPVPPPKKAA